MTWSRSVFSILLLFAAVQIGAAQTTTSKSTCKIYSLADLAKDAETCKWIAETIPQVIEPDSWQRWEGKLLPTSNGKKSTLTCNPAAKVLVVYHTAEVHEQIAEFLQSLRQTMNARKGPANTDPQVVRAQHTTPVAPPMPQPSQMSYPVPFPLAAPKHLFHFIIRYEGQGILDENVVKFAKALTQEAAASSIRAPQYGTSSGSPPMVSYSNAFTAPSSNLVPMTAPPSGVPRMLPADAALPQPLPAPTTLP